jgi:glycosyltransferase involved in cell wall biosynthesis
MESKLKSLANKYDLNDKIKFKPWMAHNELGEALSAARMCILPSREENFSLAIMSSLCVGTPTISTNVGGTPEIIDDYITGRLVEADHPEALAAVIQDFLDHPEKREELGESGAKYIRNNLTWDHACAQFEELYTIALERRK